MDDARNEQWTEIGTIAPIMPGDIIRFDGLILVIEVAGDRVLSVDVTDGLTHMWHTVETLSGCSKAVDPVRLCEVRCDAERKRSIEAVTAHGTDQARWNAERVGMWETLRSLVVALRARRP